MADDPPFVRQAEEQIEEGAHLIPGHMLGGVKRYLLDGVLTGDFLRAILSNDFIEATGRADSDNAAALMGWSRFLYNHLPSDSWGSPEAVAAIVEQGGLRGKERT